MYRRRSLQSRLLFFVLILGFSSCVQAKFWDPTKSRHKSEEESDFFHFVTRPDIRAPQWEVNVTEPESISPGYWFIAPYKNLHQKQRGARWVGPYIYDRTGELIWSGTPVFDRFNIFDFRMVQINGEDMLTAIYKREDAGVILDNSYQIQRVVDWPGIYNSSNMHDFTVSSDGQRALVLTKRHHNISGSPVDIQGECYVHSNGLRELDISGSTPKTLFSWNATDHIGLDETTYGTRKMEKQCRTGWDIHHFNAVDQFPDGDYLISSRHTDALYKISRDDGTIVWRLGGTKSDFEMIGNSKFSRQHHARVHAQNRTHTIISVFDNAKGDGPKQSNDYSRGLVLSLHNESMTAEVSAEYIHPEHGISSSRGSIQLLPNSNAFLGWTFKSRISEHTSDGRIIMEARLKGGMNTYRSYKYSWKGRPTQPPDVVSLADRDSGNTTTTIYVSWNGATAVAKWNIYGTNSLGGNDSLITSTPRQGFETNVTYDGFAKHVYAEALDETGIPLGKSEVVHTIPPNVKAAQWIKDQEWFDEHVDIEADNDNTSGVEQLDRVLSILSDPVAAYVFGIFTCATIVAVFWAVKRYGVVPWRRREAQEYEPLWKDTDDIQDDELDEAEAQILTAEKDIEFPP